jgi:transcriptional regulator of acetoin/glycerol metabolism
VVRRILAEVSPHQPISLDPEVSAILRRYNWPGNLRQLRNVLRLSIALLGNDSVLLPAHLPSEVCPGDGAVGGAGLRAIQARLARESVDRHGGNITAAARELRITRTTLYRILEVEKKCLAPPPATEQWPQR